MTRIATFALWTVIPLALAISSHAASDDVSWLESVTSPLESQPPAAVGRLAPVLQSGAGTPITTLQQWTDHRETIRSDWLAFLGAMPNPRPAVQLEVLSCAVSENVTRQLVRYEGTPGNFVEGFLLTPVDTSSNLPQRRPGIVALHPTTDTTIDQIAGVSGPDEKQLGWKLAKRGYVVFCPRCFLWQSVVDFDAAVARHRERHPGTLGMSRMLYDAQRGVDVLATLPTVDPARIGAVGHSLGAKETLYLAAFDERIKAAVFSEGGLGLRSTNWDAPWYLGEAIHDPTFALNHHQLLALIAPRPFLVMSGESGPGAADGERSRPLIDAAVPAWKLYGEPVRLGLFNHRQGHSMPPEAYQKLAEWLDAYL